MAFFFSLCVHFCLLIRLGATPLISPVSCGKDSHWALATSLPLSCFCLSCCTLMQQQKQLRKQGLPLHTPQMKLNWVDWERASCCMLMCTVGLLDLPSSGRIIQVSAGSNSPHLVERAFICLHSLTVIHHFCKRQTITSMLHTPCFFYLAGIPWWEYLSNSLAHRTHAAAAMNYSEVFLLTLSWLCVISLSTGSPTENTLLYSVR